MKHFLKLMCVLTSFFVIYIMLTADVSASITLKKPVAIGERYAISSEYVEHPPEFNVYLPSDYHLTAEHVRYPVVIVSIQFSYKQPTTYDPKPIEYKFVVC